MEETIRLQYDVPGDDFTRAGEASADIKKTLKKIGVSPDAVRRTSIATYEGEINMVIHADGGQCVAEISPGCIEITLIDHGPGIPDISLAMKEGWSTAPDTVRNLGFGAGMGLPNMKKYTDEMNIESTVGEGTTVHMKIFF